MKHKDINSVIDYLSEISHVFEEDVEEKVEEKVEDKVEEVIDKSINPNLWFCKYITYFIMTIIMFFIAVDKYQGFNKIDIRTLKSERGLLYFIVGLLSLYCLS